MVIRPGARRLVGMFAAVLMLTGLSAPPASAATATMKKHYLFTADRWSDELDICLHIVLEGNVVYRIAGPTPRNTYVIGNPRIEDPTMRVWLKSSCARSAGTVKVGTQADLTQRWYSPYRSCDITPSISVGVPWNAGISFTPSCDSKGKVARRSSHPDPEGRVTHFVQANSGRPARWDHSREQKYCLLYTATVQVYRGGRSDAFGIGGSRSGVCITPEDGKP